MVRSRFGEICSCCCLPALPEPAWVLHFAHHFVLLCILLIRESCLQLFTNCPRRRKTKRTCSPACLFLVAGKNQERASKGHWKRHLSGCSLRYSLRKYHSVRILSSNEPELRAPSISYRQSITLNREFISPWWRSWAKTVRVPIAPMKNSTDLTIFTQLLLLGLIASQVISFVGAWCWGMFCTISDRMGHGEEVWLIRLHWNPCFAGEREACRKSSRYFLFYFFGPTLSCR